MSKQLQDKIAIVTGAASGIGKEIADVYAAEGAKVVIADLNIAAAQAAAEQIKATGASAVVMRALISLRMSSLVGAPNNPW